MSKNLFSLSDEQWKRIEPHLLTKVRGKKRKDDRRVISGIVHVLKSGCRWCDCPETYGPHTTITIASRVGAARHLGKTVPGAGQQRSLCRQQLIDSTHVKAHRWQPAEKGEAETGCWPLARRA